MKFIWWGAHGNVLVTAFDSFLIRTQVLTGPSEDIRYSDIDSLVDDPGATAVVAFEWYNCSGWADWQHPKESV